MNSGGSFTAGSLDFDLDFNNSVGVTDGDNLSLNIAGNFTTTAGDVNLATFHADRESLLTTEAI